ncbi:MAG: Ig-like domain-containing protein [Pseudomonadota bacterium]
MWTRRIRINPTVVLLTALIPLGANPQSWQPIGPAAIETRGIGNVDNVPGDDPASGAVHGVAAHPTDADIIYVAAVNGGIWKTTNATAASPTWVQQTDSELSSSASDVAFDPTDGTNETLVASFGRFSSFASRGGSRQGVLRTTNGGTTWTQVGSDMIGKNIAKIVGRGSTMLAAVDVADAFTCGNVGIWRTTNGGTSWAQVTNGIASGGSDALAEDPTNSAVLYASVVDFNNICSTGDGIYRSADSGASWSKVSNATMDAQFSGVANTSDHVELTVGPTGTVFAAFVPGNTGRLSAVFYSTNSGSSWTQMDIPTTDSGAGIHPGTQGNLHTSLVADPVDSDIVYIGGDRQPRTNNDTGGFPNAIGASSFSGRLFRGDIGQPSGSQWDTITHNGTSNGSAPHPDSRDLVFDADGNLLETDDGGIYRRTLPRSASGVWEDVNGNLQVTEQHSGAFDATSQIAFSGNQDNGTTRQSTFANTVWQTFQGGDGGDVAVDILALAGSNQSIRFASSQNLGGVRRLIYNSSNGFLGSSNLALNLTSGSPLTAQFTTPIEVNQSAGSRLIIGGGNAAYESFDLGDNIAQLTPAVPVLSGGRRSIAYGTATNADLLYVISGSDGGLYQRNTGGGSLSCVYNCPATQSLQGVVQDPSDASQVFVLQSNGVVRSTNGGTSFGTVTGNLISGFTPGTLRTLAFLERPSGDALAVGTDRGVYLALASDGFSVWAEAASGLPVAPIYDIDYDPGQNRLVAFSLGRGAFAVTFSGNQAPDAVADSASVAAGGTVTALDSGQASLLFNDSDPEGDNLTLQTSPVSGPSSGSVTLNAAGTFSYTHNGTATTSDSFTYRVCDDGTPSACDDAVVSISVNQPPTAVNDSADVDNAGTVTVLSSGQTSLLFNDSDLNGDNLSLQTSPVSGPGSGSITLNANGTFSYTHNGTATTSDAVTYEVCDDGTPSQCAQAVLNIAIGVPNQTPVAVADAASVGAGAAVTTLDSGEASLLFNDSDPNGNSLTLQTAPVVAPSSGNVTLNAAGTFSYTHNGNSATSDSFTYRVCDNGSPSLCDDAVVSIAVNQPPTAVADAVSVANGGTVTVLDSGQTSLLFNDSDPNGDGLSLETTPVSDPANGSVTLNANGTFSYTHSGNFTGTDGFTYRVCDDGTPSQCATAAVSITIDTGDALCLAPAQGIPDPGFTTSTLSTATSSLLADMNVYLDISHTFVGDLGVTLTHRDTGTAVTLLDRPGSPALSAFGCNQDDVQTLFDDSAVNLAEDQCSTSVPAIGGTLRGTELLAALIGEDFAGDWDLRVSDGEGFDSGTLNRWCLVPTLGLAPNDPPTAVDDSLTVAEGATATVLDGAVGSVLANDSDTNGDNLTVTTPAQTLPSNAASFMLAANGTFSYTHNGGETTSDLVVYEVCDDGVPVRCATAQLNITVTEVNDPVVASDDTLSDIDEDSGVRVIAFSELLGDDSAGTDESTQTLVISAVGNATGGTVVINGTTVEFTPTPEFSGPASFQYTATDNGTTNGAPDPQFDIATVSFNILAVNDAPSAGADFATVTVGGTVTALVGGELSLLDNDSDIENDTLTVQTTPISGPSDGSITLNANGTFSYTHTGSVGTTDNITYRVCDDGSPSRCDDAVLQVVITDVPNQAPVAVSDATSTSVGGTVSQLNGGVTSLLANDSDPDGDNLALETTPVSGPSNGAVSLNPAGTFSYTHNGSATASDSFTYRVCDDGAPSLCADATVSVTINTVNQPPVALDDRFATDLDTVLTASVAGNDSDPDGPSAAYSVLTDTANGVLDLRSDGGFTYTPNAGFSGTDRFVYELTDGTDTAQATVQIAVGIVVFVNSFE